MSSLIPGKKGHGHDKCRFAPFVKMDHVRKRVDYVGGCCVSDGDVDKIDEDECKRLASIGLDDPEKLMKKRQRYQCLCDMIETANAVPVMDNYARTGADCAKLEREVFVRESELAVRGTHPDAWSGTIKKTEAEHRGKRYGADDLSSEQCEETIRPMFRELRDTFDGAEFVVHGEKTDAQRKKGIEACAALDAFDKMVNNFVGLALEETTQGSSMESKLIDKDQVKHIGDLDDNRALPFANSLSTGGGGGVHGAGGMIGDMIKHYKKLEVADVASKAAGAGVQAIVNAFHRGLRLVAQKNQREVNNAAHMHEICQTVQCLSGGTDLRDVVLTDPCSGTSYAHYVVSEDCPECGCPKNKEGCALKRIIAMCPSLEDHAHYLKVTCDGLFVDDVFQLSKFTHLTASETTAGRFSRTMSALSNGIQKFLAMENAFVKSYFSLTVDRDEDISESARALSDAVDAFYVICGDNAELSVLGPSLDTERYKRSKGPSTHWDPSQ